MTDKERKLREKMGALVAEAKAILDAAEKENRQPTADEYAAHSAKLDEFANIQAEVKALSSQREAEDFTAQPLAGAMGPVFGGPQLSEKEKLAQAKHATAKILATISDKKINFDKKLEVLGQIGEDLKAKGHYQGAANGFNTTIDEDGGVFLPTLVTDMILDVANVSGVFTSRGLRFPTGGARIKIPNILGRFTFQAVTETGEILVDRIAFKGMELDNLKWALFVPWSNELEGVRGAQLVDVFIRKLGQAYGDLADSVIINADGTSTYHNIKGLTNRALDSACTWVRKSAAKATRTTFAALQQDDWNAAKMDLAASLRSGAFYVAHPDREIELENALYAATANNPVKWVTKVGDQMFINNLPIFFTDRFPNTDGADKAYAALVNADYIAIADGGSFVTDLFDQASIKDKDGTTINLASSDMKALRVKTFMDVEFSPITDGGKGAFTVLFTAGS
jgi:HK97 family phage major capsid protein